MHGLVVPAVLFLAVPQAEAAADVRVFETTLELPADEEGPPDPTADGFPLPPVVTFTCAADPARRVHIRVVEG